MTPPETGSTTDIDWDTLIDSIHDYVIEDSE